jgi:hypothetical protein
MAADHPRIKAEREPVEHLRLRGLERYSAALSAVPNIG